MADAGDPPTLRALILGQSLATVEPLQLEPFRRHQSELKNRFGLALDFAETKTFADKAAALAARPCDVAFIQTSWKDSPDATAGFFRAIHAKPDRPKIVYLDSFDSSASPFFGVLPFVDAYVKKQLLRDRAAYDADLAGGYVFTNFLARELNVDLHGWHLGSRVPAGEWGKIVLGWNVGTADRFRDPLLKRGPARWRRTWPLPARRTIDVACRVSLGSAAESEAGGWYRLHRRTAVERVAELAPKFAVVAEGYGKGPAGRVKPWRYRLELRRSKLCVSPFGYGEICYRDFEAALAGCLLVKPDLSHLRTRPDLFEAGETYAAVRWDWSDLPAVCRHYLARPDERRRVVRTARRRYKQYFAGGLFFDAVAEVLRKVGLLSGATEGPGGRR